MTSDAERILRSLKQDRRQIVHLFITLRFDNPVGAQRRFLYRALKPVLALPPPPTRAEQDAMLIAGIEAEGHRIEDRWLPVLARMAQKRSSAT